MQGFPRAVILIDRARYHTSTDVKRWLRAHPGIITTYLPGASPHMNPVENLVTIHVLPSFSGILSPFRHKTSLGREHVQNLWGVMYAYLRRAGYDSFEEFKYRIFDFLRCRTFDLDVVGKLDSRLDPAAEERIILVRQQS